MKHQHKWEIITTGCALPRWSVGFWTKTKTWFSIASDISEEPDAHLIVAAPDMLAALENLMATSPYDIDCEDNIDAYRGFVKRVAREAINKAKGGAK